MATLSIAGAELVIHDAHAQTVNGEIKIAFLSDFEHIAVFEYAVSEFNREQAAINNSNYHITSRIISTDLGNSTITSDIRNLEADGFKYFVGPLASSSTEHAKTYVDTTSDIVLLSPSSTAASLAIADDGIFRLVPSDNRQASILMDHIQSQGRDHVVIIFRGDIWGTELNQVISDNYAESVALAIRLEPDGSNAHTVAADAAAKVRELVSAQGAANVAVLLLAFDNDSVELVDVIASDANLADSFENVRWYGADGTTEQSELVDNTRVAEFLQSVNFASSKFEAAPNSINLIIEAQSFNDDASYADSLYDAVFLLADTVIVNDMQLETNPNSTVRSLILDVASGVHTHDYHDPQRTIGAGALGDYEFNQYGDLSAPLTYVFYGITQTSEGYQWVLLGADVVDFTAAERAWLDANPTLSVGSSDWPPYEYSYDGELAGVTAAMADRFSDITGTQFVASDAAGSWSQTLAGLRSGDVDVTFMISQTGPGDIARAGIAYTDPWISVPTHIIVQSGNPNSVSVENLASKKVVSVENYAVNQWLDDNGITYSEVGTTVEALQLVADGTYDAHIENWDVAQRIDSASTAHLEDAGLSGYTYDLTIGYTATNTELGGILSKVLDGIESEIDVLVDDALAAERALVSVSTRICR